MGAGPTHCLKLYYLPLPWFNLNALEDALYQIVDLIRPIIEPLGYFFMAINIDEKENCVSIYLSKLRTPYLNIVAIIAAIGIVAAIVGCIFIGGKLLDYMTAKTEAESWKTSAELYKDLLDRGLTPTQAEEAIKTIGETVPEAPSTTTTFFPPQITNILYVVLAIAIVGIVGGLVSRR